METRDFTLKKEATKRFYIYGNLIPLILPLAILLIYNHCTGTFKIDNLPIFGTMIMPNLVYFAYILYDKQVGSSKFWTEKKVDFLLYLVATITMLLIASQINRTGGFDNSILIFYFYYIPSAIAISFKAKWGLIITLFLSFCSIIYNYLNKPEVTQDFIDSMNSYKYLYMGIIAIHLFSLGLLEFNNNEKNETK